MELIRYLEHHFFTREQLLARCGIDGAALDRLQRQRRTPTPSYRLRLDAGCESFFGPHIEEVAVDYYAKGCVAWIDAVAALGGEEAPARALFIGRYTTRLEQLAASDVRPAADLTDEAHLLAEWNAFLDGTYGTCTVSGLPEDIAAKEAAIAVIREVTGGGAVEGAALLRLRRAVDLLDSVAAPFAPHELARSSRRRYVDDMRMAYRL
jgi:hypothetical protein